MYDKLRCHLPTFFADIIPVSGDRSAEQVPHRGEILEFNRQVPLSRPLFDGFATAAQDSREGDEQGSSSLSSTNAVAPKHIVHERLPNGWVKKAVKRLQGATKGKPET